MRKRREIDSADATRHARCQHVRPDIFNCLPPPSGKPVMIARQRIILRSRAEAERLGAPRVVEVTPSRRDFRLYVSTQRQSLAVIAQLPAAGEVDELVALAQRFDDAEVAAIAVRGDDDGLNETLVRQLSDSVSAPLLRSDYVVAANQIYHSRLLGFDAVVIPATELSAAQIQDLVAVTSSVHMAAVVEVIDAATLDRASSAAHAILAIASDRYDEPISAASAAALCALIPERRNVLALAERPSAQACHELRGLVDAVVLGTALAEAEDPADLVSSLAG